MPLYFDITRAARLAGVSRREIQQRISDGDLPSFEGKVEHTALARLFPRATTPPPGMVEYVSDIKEAALTKAPSRDIEQADADPDQLAQRLAEARAALNRADARAAARMSLLRETEQALTRLADTEDAGQRSRALLSWLRQQLQRDGIR